METDSQEKKLKELHNIDNMPSDGFVYHVVFEGYGLLLLFIHKKT